MSIGRTKVAIIGCGNVGSTLGYYIVSNQLSNELVLINRNEKRVLDESLIYEVLSVVEEIPEGKVATYGQIAALIGRERNARLVGRVLGMADFYGDYPCHRVVNHAGRLAPHFEAQRDRLLAEDVPFRDESHVDLSRCRWDPQA